MSQETPSRELESLLLAYVEDDCDAAQSQRLDELICDDDAAVDAYVDMMTMHAMLQWRFGRQPNRTSPPSIIQATSDATKHPETLDDLSHLTADATLPTSALPQLNAPRHPPASTYVAAPLHGTYGYISSGWPMAYLIATVVVGIGIAIAAITHVSQPEQKQLVQQSDSLPSSPSPLPSAVGRITGMVNCVWKGSELSGQGSEPNAPKDLKSPVALGDRFGISSGLLEITYDSGAKVILQGPVTYEVESATGGHLSVGKLTARLEHKATDTGTPISKSQIPNPKSPLFAVRTPTAIVTDLGTEFGVEVDASGITTSHVFRGFVEVRSVADATGEGNAIRLGQRESARVETNKTGKPAVHRVTWNPEGFARQLPILPAGLLLRDSFDTRADASQYGETEEYGLNQELAARQSGLFQRVPYLSGGDYAKHPTGLPSDLVQVNTVLCPGKLCLSADYGQAGWVSLNRRLPCDVTVSAQLAPGAIHWPDKSHSEVFVRNHQSANWVAMGLRGRGGWFDHNLLPLATDAGAVVCVSGDGNWGYFENGRRLSSGRVPAKTSYRLELSIVDNRLQATINDVKLPLDTSNPQGIRTLRGMARETSGGYLSLGANNAIFSGGVNVGGAFDVDSRDMSTIDNLIISAVRNETGARADKGGK